VPRKQPAKSAANLLDELLPLAEPGGEELHLGAALLQVSEPAQLLELAADSALRPFLICRLAPNVALVDPGEADRLVEALRKRGHTPKVMHDS
jgi:hypothetical protein